MKNMINRNSGGSIKETLTKTNIQMSLSNVDASLNFEVNGTVLGVNGVFSSQFVGAEIPILIVTYTYKDDRTETIDLIASPNINTLRKSVQRIKVECLATFSDGSFQKVAGCCVVYSHT